MAEDKTALTRTAPLAPALKDSAAKATRGLWTALVAMATLGGALGLYQFFFDREPASLPTTELVSRMIETGRITAENADTLLALLQDNVAPDSNLQSVFDEGSDAQREAIAMIAVSSTRERGLELLRAKAETAEDWSALAGFASGRKDTGDIAMEAIRKAIALEPGELRYLLQLASIQSGMGDFAASQRTLASASALAITPEEKLRTLIREIDADETANLTDRREENIALLTAVIDRVRNTPDYGPPMQTVTGEGLTDTPAYLVTYALISLTQLHYKAQDFEAALPVAQEALEEIETVLPMTEGRAREKALVMKQRVLSTIATLMHRLERGEEHFQAHESALALNRELAEQGNVAAIRTLPGALYSLAHEYHLGGQNERAVERVAAAIPLQDDLDRRYPDEWERSYFRQAMLASMAQFEGDTEEQAAQEAKLIEMIEDDLLKDGLMPERISYLVRLPRSVRVYWGGKPKTLERLSPQLAQIDGVHARLLKRFGPHEQLDRLKLGVKLERALQHEMIGNTDTAIDIHRELADLSDALPDDFEGRGGFLLYALYYLGKLDSENAVQHADRALAYAGPLAAEGKLRTGEQWALAHFTKVKNGDPDAYPSDED